MRKITVTNLILAFLLFALSSPAEEISYSLNPETDFGFNAGRLSQSIKDNNIHAFHIELSKLLEDPVHQFLQAIHKRGEEQNSNVLKLIYENVLRLEIADQNIWEQEGRALLQVLTPPIGKKDREGLSALQKAVQTGNVPAQMVFDPYYKDMYSDYELYEDSQNPVWRRSIPQFFLEDTDVGKALLEEDLSDFQSAIIDLAKGPAKNLLALFHNRTRQGDTLFHLVAKVQLEREGFASTFKTFIDQIMGSQLKTVRIGLREIHSYLYFKWVKKESMEEINETEASLLKYKKHFSNLTQAIKDDSISNYYQELKKILEEVPVISFIKLDFQKELFKLIDQVEHKEDEFKNVVHLKDELWNLNLVFIPPANKKNSKGQTALDISLQEGNAPARKFFHKYRKNELNSELYSESEDTVLEEYIPQTFLEDTPLGRALLKEDFEAFRSAFLSLAKEPIQNLLILFHNRTRQGDTLFHLVAKAKSHQKIFTETLDKLFYHFMDKHVPVAQKHTKLKAYLTMSGIYLTAGLLPLDFFQLFDMTFITASMLYLSFACYEIFSKKSKKTDNKN